MMKCRLWSSENTDRTYSPGLPWLSLTRKSPCCRSNSWASVRGIAPWYHSCSARGRSDVGMTSKNCCVGKQYFNFTLIYSRMVHLSGRKHQVTRFSSYYELWKLYHKTNRSGGTQHGFRRPNHPGQRVPQRVEARALLFRFVLNTHTHTHHLTYTHTLPKEVWDESTSTNCSFYSGSYRAGIILVWQSGGRWGRRRRGSGRHLGIQQSFLGSEARFRAAERLDCMMKLEEGQFLTEKQDAAAERQRLLHLPPGSSDFINVLNLLAFPLRVLLTRLDFCI